MQGRTGAILDTAYITSKMPKIRKTKVAEDDIPNYSNYKYSDTLGHFAEHDRLLKNELNSLECYGEYQLERSLNSFDNKTLNNHLYQIYYKKKMETTVLIRKWISYFVCQHHIRLTAHVQDYLDSKKLSMDDWTCSVKKGR